MKKILVFITLNMVLCFIGANAQPFQVEKAYKVKVSDKKVTAGMSLKENDIINIDNNGYLLIVDVQTKNRYYINFSCRSKVSNLIKKGKNPMTVTTTFIDKFFSSPRRNTDYASSGNIIRGDEDENLMPVSQKAELADKENPKEEIAPTTIEMDSSDIDGETVTLFIVMP